MRAPVSRVSVSRTQTMRTLAHDARARAAVSAVPRFAASLASTFVVDEAVQGHVNVSECGSWNLSGGWPGTEHVPAGRKLARVVGGLVGRGGTLLDLGAGSGQYGLCFNQTGCAKDLGIVWSGFDGAPNVEEYTPRVRATEMPELPVTMHANLAEDAALPLSDWVMSIEVGEHLPPEHTARYVNNLHKANRHGVIISWATSNPWQYGYHHINNHDKNEMECMFQHLGYRFDEDASQSGRWASSEDAVDRTSPLLPSFMVFRRQEGLEEDRAAVADTIETYERTKEAVEFCLRWDSKHEIAAAYWRGGGWRAEGGGALGQGVLQRKWELINEPTPGHIDDDRVWREEEVLTPRLCMLMFETGCERHPQLLGLFDDSSQAYQDYHVGTNETRCLQRSKDYWEWCGNSLAQLVVAFFVPSGSELAHPFETTDV